MSVSRWGFPPGRDLLGWEQQDEGDGHGPFPQAFWSPGCRSAEVPAFTHLSPVTPQCFHPSP